MLASRLKSLRRHCGLVAFFVHQVTRQTASEECNTCRIADAILRHSVVVPVEICPFSFQC
jgi:hypothetical protein